MRKLKDPIRVVGMGGLFKFIEYIGEHPLLGDVLYDPNNGYNIRIEPYDYFIGTGEVHNWTNLISYDKGFTVEPALNYIESEIQFTDQEDNDEGNRLFKTTNTGEC
jgi:hypothetical protein